MRYNFTPETDEDMKIKGIAGIVIIVLFLVGSCSISLANVKTWESGKKKVEISVKDINVHDMGKSGSEYWILANETGRDGTKLYKMDGWSDIGLTDEVEAQTLDLLKQSLVSHTSLYCVVGPYGSDQYIGGCSRN